MPFVVPAVASAPSGSSTRVLIATLGWGVVQDAAGNSIPNMAYEITQLDDEYVIDGFTNAKGEIPGTILSGVYKLRLAAGPVRIVHVLAYDAAVFTTDTRLPTQDENDALQGTAGVPSVTNRYVSETDTRIANAPDTGEKQALAGTFGTPSSTNKYVTNSDSRIGIGFASPLSAVRVGEVGDLNQIRAGRPLTNADFTSQGLNIPIVIWNLSDLLDASGNNRALINKGAIAFVPGINGIASTSAQFVGDVTKGLYLPDNNTAGDPFRIRTGSWGGWTRTPKAAQQWMISKIGAAGTSAVSCYGINISFSGLPSANSFDGTNSPIATGKTFLQDDRWHFLVATHDGFTLRIYCDGVLEGQVAAAPMNVATPAPVNIGGFGMDSVTNIPASMQHYGRCDEQFITGDVLSPEHVRNLYCASIPHTMGFSPTDVRLRVNRSKRGRVLLTTDFPSTPQRLYNWTNGSQLNEGTTQSGDIVGVGQGSGSIVPVAGVDGKGIHAYYMTGAHGGITASDSLLPTTTATRAYGAWFRTTAAIIQGIIGWGTSGANTHTQISLNNIGQILFQNGTDTVTGPVLNDGLWHWAGVVECNTPVDSLKRKCFIDGEFFFGSTTLNSLINPGTNGLKIGMLPTFANPWAGAIGSCFIHTSELSEAQMRTIYNAAGSPWGYSPKDAADHVEVMGVTNLLATFDTLDFNDVVDMQVAA